MGCGDSYRDEGGGEHGMRMKIMRRRTVTVRMTRTKRRRDVRRTRREEEEGHEDDVMAFGVESNGDVFL